MMDRCYEVQRKDSAWHKRDAGEEEEVQHDGKVFKKYNLGDNR